MVGIDWIAVREKRKREGERRLTDRNDSECELRLPVRDWMQDEGIEQSVEGKQLPVEHQLHQDSDYLQKSRFVFMKLIQTNQILLRLVRGHVHQCNHILNECIRGHLDVFRLVYLQNGIDHSPDVVASAHVFAEHLMDDAEDGEWTAALFEWLEHVVHECRGVHALPGQEVAVHSFLQWNRIELVLNEMNSP